MINGLVNRLPLTMIRLYIARLIYRVVSLFVNSNILHAKRGGINYELDLSEGIDLSLFIFGSYQKDVLGTKHIKNTKNWVVFDVGANIGAMALYYANLALPQGHIYAFEPTDYAFEKLKKNVSLNPKLENIMTLEKTFISEQEKVESNLEVYSSWKVDQKGENTHPTHGGTAKMASFTPTTTLDKYVDRNSIRQVDLIKIDTDGYELEVLQGAKEMIIRFRPHITFEVGLYLLDERGISFEQYIQFFSKLNYSLISLKSGKIVDSLSYRKQIPQNSTIDILARAN